MPTPVTCMHCGLPVDDVSAIYKYLLNEKIIKMKLNKSKTLPTNAMLDDSLQIDMSDIWEDLGITEDHCRSTLTTNMDVDDYY